MSSADRNRAFSGQSAVIFVLPALLLLWPAAAASRPGESNLSRESLKREREISVSERRRELIILPFENDTGVKDFDYLRRGVAKILTARLQKYGYLIVPHVRKRFYFRTEARTTTTSDPEERDLPGRLPLEVRYLPYDRDNYRLLKTGRPANIAFEEKADYLVWGWLEKGTESGKLNLQVHLYDARAGHQHSFAFVLDPREYTVELEKPAARLFLLLSEKAPVQLEVETSVPGARAYLDELYLGRTPLTYQAVPGRYRLQIKRRGFQTASTQVEIRSGNRNLFRVWLVPRDYRSRLVIRTTPPGAAVYLDAEYLGRTPLQRESLEPGSHRLRTVLEGHIDRFVGVRLSNDRETELDLALKPGDTRAAYQDPGYVLLDWTRTDMFFASLMTTLGFYGSWGYYRIRADRAASSIRATSLFLFVPGVDPLAELSGLTELALLYQIHIYRENSRLVRRYQRNANISAGAGGITLLLAGFFLFQELTEEREIGEIGLGDPFPKPEVWLLNGDFSAREEEGLSLGWTIRF